MFKLMKRLNKCLFSKSTGKMIGRKSDRPKHRTLVESIGNSQYLVRNVLDIGEEFNLKYGVEYDIEVFTTYEGLFENPEGVESEQPIVFLPYAKGDVKNYFIPQGSFQYDINKVPEGVTVFPDATESWYKGKITFNPGDKGEIDVTHGYPLGNQRIETKLEYEVLPEGKVLITPKYKDVNKGTVVTMISIMDRRPFNSGVELGINSDGVHTHPVEQPTFDDADPIAIPIADGGDPGMIMLDPPASIRSLNVAEARTVADVNGFPGEGICVGLHTVNPIPIEAGVQVDERTKNFMPTFSYQNHVKVSKEEIKNQFGEFHKFVIFHNPEPNKLLGGIRLNERLMLADVIDGKEYQLSDTQVLRYNGELSGEFGGTLLNQEGAEIRNTIGTIDYAMAFEVEYSGTGSDGLGGLPFGLLCSFVYVKGDITFDISIEGEQIWDHGKAILRDFSSEHIAREYRPFLSAMPATQPYTVVGKLIVDKTRDQLNLVKPTAFEVLNPEFDPFALSNR